ncbi:hypothetical protein B0H67DRAFT_640324 [Lasiosphaeris hirsuta]|uniref:Uncharacterized protein n=1 Tax=Lasiosphaeris hirsuta TaxID=260670 RepID=A0AA40BD40_9PEZI|nr:hypothetical protein B0H67DRAFT_640324 [Lasiosphaeris hirsuta]
MSDVDTSFRASLEKYIDSKVAEPAVERTMVGRRAIVDWHKWTEDCNEVRTMLAEPPTRPDVWKRLVDAGSDYKACSPFKIWSLLRRIAGEYEFEALTKTLEEYRQIKCTNLDSTQAVITRMTQLRVKLDSMAREWGNETIDRGYAWDLFVSVRKAYPAHSESWNVSLMKNELSWGELMRKLLAIAKRRGGPGWTPALANWHGTADSKSR